ncbi:MAG: hypothetical protein IPQ24_16165 [Anaeromyxobacter sp.]|nr:hypothetical protein [Anaeromyxobacter sp.]
MRKWMVMAGLAAAVLAVVLLLPGAPKETAPGHTAASPAAGHPAQGADLAAAGHAAAGTPDAPAGHGAPAPGSAGEAAAGDMHEGVLDEGTRAMLAYPVTLPKLKSYVAAVKEIRAAGARDPKLLARFREPGPAGEMPAAAATRLEAIAPLKAILDRHHLGGLDLVLLPRAVVSGRNAYALEQEGRPLPVDQVNVTATSLFRADLPGMDQLNKAYADDLKFLSGR